MGLIPYGLHETLTGPFGRAFMILINMLVSYDGLTGPTKLYPDDYAPNLTTVTTVSFGILFYCLDRAKLF